MSATEAEQAAIQTDPPAGIRRRAALRLGGLLRRGIWGLCDQTFISGTNFATTVVLARDLGPGRYGAFAIVYAAIFFASAAQSALVTRPHNVIGTAQQGAGYRRYTTATAASQLAFIGVLAFIVLGAAAIARGDAAGIGPLLLPLLPALVAWQVQEFIRRVLYTEGRLKDAFLNDCVSYGTQAVGIIALGRFGLLTGARALYIIALTSAVAALWGCWQIRRSLDARAIRGALRERWLVENWRFGRWIFGAILVASASSQIYTALIGGLISVAEAGAFRAIITVFGPARILLSAMETSLTPAAARIYNERGQPGLNGFILRVVLLSVPVMVGYSLLVSIFATPLLGTVFGEGYRQYGWLLVLVALTYVLMYLLSPVVIALEGQRLSAPVFHAGLCSGLLGLAVGVVVIHLFGLVGAAVGMIVDVIISNTILWWRYARLGAPRAPAVAA